MSSPFVKQLVASDRKTRDAALASLTKFLSSSRQFDELELLKLWKALFFCFWHSDRTLVQQALAQDLANLTLSVKEFNVIPFLKAFWTTICREWNGIDILRLDKFYTLLRRLIGAAFSRLVSVHWSEDLLQEYVSLLEALPLSAGNMKMPNGIRYHLADIYMEELGKAVGEGDKSKVPIDTILRPFEIIITKSPTKSVRLRVMKSVFEDKTLADYGYEMAREASDDEDMNGVGGSASSDDDASDIDDEESVSDNDSDQDESIAADEEFTGFD